MMEYPVEVYYMALGRVKGVGPVVARQIVEAMGDVHAVFTDRAALKTRLSRLSSHIIEALYDPTLLSQTEADYRKHVASGIAVVSLEDTAYPAALKECVDAPVVLFVRGELSSLNRKRMLSIVGTRNITLYGKQITEKLVCDLAASVPDAVIVSGLAYGVDVAAHEAALKAGLSTVGVLGHGLDMIYPYKHSAVASRMQSSGALVSEYPLGTGPERYNFVGRNRIIAGLSQATLVVESAEKGGSLITAGLAVGYDRDVLAIPGRVGDVYSSGCNHLIRTNRAVMVTSAQEIVETLGWDSRTAEKPMLQFEEPDLPDDPLLRIIASEGSVQINDLARKAGLEVSEVAAALFDYELDGYIVALPGGIYTLGLR